MIDTAWAMSRYVNLLDLTLRSLVNAIQRRRVDISIPNYKQVLVAYYCVATLTKVATLM